MSTEIKKPLPILGWEITNDCNLHCPHCYNPIERQKNSGLEWDECIRIIDSSASLGTTLIAWTGGEPLLRQDLADLIRYAGTTHGIKSSITTNGVLLDREKAQQLKDAGLKSFQISIDGSTPQRSYLIRRTTDEEFHKIIDAIRICRELDIPVYLAMLLGAENLDDGFEMLKLARREGALGVRFCGFTPAGRAHSKGIQERFLFGDRLPELYEFILKAYEEDDLQVFFDPGFGPIPPDFWFHECVAGVQTCYIKANGDVYPCTSMLYDRFVVGNIRERSLEDLWNDPRMSSMSPCGYEDIEGVCSVCDNAENCHGACRCLTYAHTGSFTESFPVCLYQVGNKIEKSN